MKKLDAEKIAKELRPYVEEIVEKYRHGELDKEHALQQLGKVFGRYIPVRPSPNLLLSKIDKLLDSGCYTISEITKRLNLNGVKCSYDRVYKLVRENKDLNSKYKFQKSLAEEKLKENLERAYIDKGLSARKTAKEVGLSRNTTNKLLHKHGFAQRKEEEERFLVEEIEKCYVANLWSKAKTAKELGKQELSKYRKIDRSFVRRVIKKYRLDEKRREEKLKS
jgi:uncharacterized protein YbgA (DUF1722 family)